MSERQAQIIKFLRMERTLAAWQLATSYRVDAPIASIRRDIGTLRQNGINIKTVTRKFGYANSELAYQLVSK